MRAGIRLQASGFGLRALGSSRSDSGLTLVEMMVSLLLAAMLAAGLFYLMSGQSKTYEIQTAGLINQENLWGAMEYVQSEVRKAGHGLPSCPGGVLIKGMASPSAVTAITVYNGCNLFTTDPSTCPGNPNATVLNGASAGNAAPNNDGVDSLTIAYTDPYSASTPGSTVRVQKLTGGAVTFVDSPGSFAVCDLVMIWDPVSGVCHLAMLSGIGPSGGPPPGRYQLRYNPGGSCSGMLSTYNLPSMASWNHKQGLMLTSLGNHNNYKPRHIAIDDTVDPPRLVTWTTAAANPRTDTADLEVIAHGVEDMQISASCDNGRPSAAGTSDGLFLEGDGAGAPKSDDEWAWNVVNDTKPDCGARPIGQVRITITARSHGFDPTMSTGRRPAAEDRPAGGVDKYHRRTLTVTVSPRNLR